MGSTDPKTLYVGNLDMTVSEDFLCTLFGQMGPIKNCKIIREPGNNDPYAFIEFATHQAASTALTAMNKRMFLDKEMKVNWATSPGNQPKTDISAHHHIFVGDLSPEIDQDTLREAFSPFGEISNCRIVKDPQTLKSRGYAFVSFVKKAEAENAIQAMNGQWLGSRSIRTNWSTRKPPAPREPGMKPGGLCKGDKPSFDEIYNQSSPTNTTVYFGGLPANAINEYLVQKQFAMYGTIEDVRVFKDKGFAFIKFTSKEAATHAIEATHNAEIMGKPVKCFWGRENGGEMGNNSSQQHQQQQQQLQQQLQQQQQQQQQQQPLQQPSAGQIATMQSQGVAAAAAAAAAAQYPYSYQQMYQMYYQPTGYPAQIPAQYAMQQGYYPYAYTTNPQQGAGEMFSAYRMNVQPAAAAAAMYVGVPTVQGVANVATNGAATAQPPIVYTALPQYQTQ